MISNLLVNFVGAQWTAYVVLVSIALVLTFLAALAAIILIMFQKSNSDGIQGITASSETFFGKNKGRSIESKLKKWTWILLGVIAGLSIAVYIVIIILQNV